jgi:hypothetical protein
VEEMKCVIYDYETLSQNAFNGVVLSVAGIAYDEDRFLTNPYTYEGLLDSCEYVKFDVKDQVKYGRKVEKGSLDWWKSQSKYAQKQLMPSDNDVPISELLPFLERLNIATAKKVFTRGNSFDPVFTRSLCDSLGIEDPTPWWTIRDVRSYVDGFTYGTDINHDFIPKDLVDKFVQHDPSHDVAMDVMRMQFLIRTIYGKD